MSEFGKWYDVYSYWVEIDEEGLPLTICKDTWQAALVWVLERVDCANSDGSVIQDIKDELKNLNKSNS